MNLTYRVTAYRGAIPTVQRDVEASSIYAAINKLNKHVPRIGQKLAVSKWLVAKLSAKGTGGEAGRFYVRGKPKGYIVKQ